MEHPYHFKLTAKPQAVVERMGGLRLRLCAATQIDQKNRRDRRSCRGGSIW
jgi:hypothetical protein